MELTMQNVVWHARVWGSAVTSLLIAMFVTFFINGEALAARECTMKEAIQFHRLVDQSEKLLPGCKAALDSYASGKLSLQKACARCRKFDGIQHQIDTWARSHPHCLGGTAETLRWRRSNVLQFIQKFQTLCGY
jgi:hypothetical protein